MDALTLRADVGSLAPAEECTPRKRLFRVFENGRDGLFRFVLVRVGGDRHAAEDILQQACLEAARSRRIPSTDDACEAWVRGIARNQIRKFARTNRRGGRRHTLEDADTARRLVEAMEAGQMPEFSRRDENTAALLMAVTALSAAEQKLVWDAYFEGRTVADIAADREASPKAIESRLYRIRKRLRALLGNPNDETGDES